MSIDTESYKGKHAGEVGLVLANGPSFADVPNEFLWKYPTIGCNHMGCACDHTFFYPTYWSQIGANQIETPEQRLHYYPAIESADLAFVNKAVRHLFPQQNVIGIMSRGAQGKQLIPPHFNRAFSEDPTWAVGVGFTQTYVSLQIAYWLGFETVLIVGLDNDYNADPDKRHFYEDAPHNSDPPFHGNRRFIDGSNYVFQLAREAFEADKRKVINLTPHSKAVALESGRLEDWL